MVYSNDLVISSHLSWSLNQMEAQSSSGLLLTRKRRREGSNGETDESERLVKIPRCTVVRKLSLSPVFAQHLFTLSVLHVLTHGRDALIDLQWHLKEWWKVKV